MSKVFLDIQVGDIVIVYDEYLHDYVEHRIEIEDVQYDKEYSTESNPDGMICYGTDLDEEEWGDDYISFVHEGNFIRMGDMYGCEGRNHNCQGLVEWDNVNWFTSSIGFCDTCWDKLHKTLTDEEMENLYNACESGDSKAVERIVNATR